MFHCVKVDAQGDDADTEQPTDETLKTEHEVTDVQQVDSAQGVTGTSDDQNGQEVCVCVCVLCVTDIFVLNLSQNVTLVF